MDPSKHSLSTAPGPSSVISIDRRRPRASTMELKLPQPENHPDKYNEDRVQAGVNYVNRRLTSASRKPSPIQSKLLCLYKLVCVKYLEQSSKGFEGNTRSSILSEIRRYEEELSRYWWIRANSDDQSQTLEEELLKIRRIQYYARYGDYAARVAHEVRRAALEHQVRDWALLSGTYQWTTISERLQQEAEYWIKHGSTKGTSKIATTYAVYQACLKINMNMKQTVAAIHTYGARNQSVHSPINALVAQGKFSDIAVTLSQDLADLVSTMPIDLSEEESHMRAILVELRERWFTILADEFDNPSSWIATPALVREYQLTKTPAKKEEARKEHEVDVARGAVRLLDHASRRAQLVEQLEERHNPNILPAGGPLPTGKKSAAKRKASRELSGQHEAKTIKLTEPTKEDREKAWMKIMDNRKRAKSAYESSFQMQEEVNRIVLYYRETFGEDPPPESSSSSSTNTDPRV